MSHKIDKAKLYYRIYKVSKDHKSPLLEFTSKD